MDSLYSTADFNKIQNLREKVAQPTDTRGGGLL